MKTIAQIEQDILFITMKIQRKSPELSKYLIETPIKYSYDENNKISRANLLDYYSSLVELTKSYSKERSKINHSVLTKLKHTVKNAMLSGYPSAPLGEDAYDNWEKEARLNPEDLSQLKAPNELPGKNNEKSFDDDMSGADLDVPGAELDDQQENIGSEDEENNYYSLGGDNHNNLDENNSKSMNRDSDPIQRINKHTKQ